MASRSRPTCGTTWTTLSRGGLSRLSTFAAAAGGAVLLWLGFFAQGQVRCFGEPDRLSREHALSGAPS